jgi:hypothetical protein
MVPSLIFSRRPISLFDKPSDIKHMIWCSRSVNSVSAFSHGRLRTYSRARARSNQTQVWTQVIDRLRGKPKRELQRRVHPLRGRERCLKSQRHRQQSQQQSQAEVLLGVGGKSQRVGLVGRLLIRLTHGIEKIVERISECTSWCGKADLATARAQVRK